MNNFKSILKELRVSEGLTQKDLAEFLQVSYTTYASYEQGRSEPNIDTIIKLAGFFKVSTDYLLGNE